uniref:Uncharacterized protein n=1 Tax=Cyanothece sp. (strain PCC 7425 / ATCC 29141) TaxID=395961 RepID=B8HNS9_CYAP4
MRAIKVMGTINDQGQLALDQPLEVVQNSRVEVIVLIQEETNEDDSSNEEILADFRQAWHEVMTEQTIPVSQLWDDIEHG